MPHTSPPGATTGTATSDHRRHHEPHRYAGGAGHWVRTVGALAPLVIGEFVKDPERKWRFIRITSVLLAVASEVSYARRIEKERQERDAREEQRETTAR